MSKSALIYEPLTKKIIIQGHTFKIKALTFEDLKVIAIIPQGNTIEFTKAVMDKGMLESEADVSSLSLPVYTEVLKEILDFSGLGQNNSMFNPSSRQQQP